MSEKFTINVDLGFVVPPQAAFDRRTFPALSAAVRELATRAEVMWKAYAQGAPLPNGGVINDRTGTYLRSITMTMTGDFSALVSSNAPYAEAIESGSPARDMKTMLNSSLKVRVAKDGTRYLIIPFRWNVPNSVMGNSMPQAVHNWWVSDTRENSHITGSYRRVSGTGAYDMKTRKQLTVPGWNYHWGTRLGENDLAGLGLGDRMTKQLQGMVRFRNPKPKEAGQNTQYLTFRVMSEKSSGWIAKAQPGRYPARTVAEAIRAQAEKTFAAAAEGDVENYLRTALGK